MEENMMATKKIKEFATWDIAQQAGKDITAALQEFAASRGLAVTFGQISKVVQSDNMTLLLNVSVIAETAKLAMEAAAQRQEYVEKAESLGLKLEWLDKYFVADRGRSLAAYDIVGLDTSNAKFPVVVQKTSNDKRYRYTLDGVKKAMEQREQSAAKFEADKAATAASK
jgi:hypothetical protein